MAENDGHREPGRGTAQLTGRQRRLIEEIGEIQATMALDVNLLIEHSDSAQELSTHLEFARRRLIAADVVSEYAFIDELLGSALARYYFPRRRFIALWRTKKFRRFNYFVLKKLSLIEKLDHVSDVRTIPAEVVNFIQRLNALRNALAHAFFLENLRGRRASWGGHDIFSIEGFRAFEADADAASRYLVRRALLGFTYEIGFRRARSEVV